MIRPALPFVAALPLAAALLLPACSKQSTSDQETGSTASGEVLQGSISDAMIPYDQLRSQPPVEPVTLDKDGMAGTATPTDNATPGATQTEAPDLVPSASPTPPAAGN